jgi:hypothetical protein
MRQLLGVAWSTHDIDWFRTRTICRACNRFFDTTDPADRCSRTDSKYHTYTRALDDIVRRAVCRAYRRSAPPLFLPGARASEVSVVPPEPLEKDWLFVDDEEKTAQAVAAEHGAASSSSSSSAAPAPAVDDAVHPPKSEVLPPYPAYNSAELHELEIRPEDGNAVPVSDERARASYLALVSSLPAADRALHFPAPPREPPAMPESDLADQIRAAPSAPESDPVEPPPAYRLAAGLM